MADQTPGGTNGATTLWRSQQQLLDSQEGVNPTSMTEELYQLFLLDKQGTSLSDLSRIKQAKRPSSFTGTTDLALLNQQLGAVQAAVNTASQNNIDPIVLGEYQNLLQAYQQLWLTANSNLQEEQHASWQQLQQENENLSSTSLAAQNEILFNQLYFTKQLEGSVSEEALLSLAEQCVQAGGRAVTWSRAWYEADYGLRSWPSDCAEQQNLQQAPVRQTASNSITANLSNKEQAPGSDIVVYPNPVQDVLYLQGPLETASNWRLMNGVGQTVFERTSISGEKFALSIKAFPAGTYTLLYLDKGEQLQSKRIVVLPY
jgi:hypothetical protein